jgi:aminoglycoside 6'-N-acetyltransferase
MGLTLRSANITDLRILRDWDTKDHVNASDPNDDWNWEVELTRQHDWREQLIAELDGVPIGFIQIIDPEREESKYWGDVSPNLRAVDIWIGEKENLGKGYGKIMMQLALKRCFSDDRVLAGSLIRWKPIRGLTNSMKSLGSSSLKRSPSGKMCVSFIASRKEIG